MSVFEYNVMRQTYTTSIMAMLTDWLYLERQQIQFLSMPNVSYATTHPFIMTFV